MPISLNTKHPVIEGVTQEEARRVLRASVGDGNLGLEEVIRTLDCDAARGDYVLRAMAESGYLEISDAKDQLLYWTLTSIGRRLRVEKNRPRIDTEKVRATIAEVVARAKAINSDTGRLQRIKLKLFGSALEEREDYGDVDVAISFHIRTMSEQEKQRVVMALEARQSASDRQTFFGRLTGAERQDTREIRAALKKGLPQLSLMDDDPMELGTPYLWLIDHDVETDVGLEVTQSLIRPNSSLPSVRGTPRSLPPATRIQARHRELAPTTKVAAADLYVGLHDAARLEEAMWSPRVTRNGALIANDVRSDPTIRFAGFQHLCPIWKQPINGVAMLKRALEWCDEQKVWVRDLFPILSISRGHRYAVIRLGSVGELMFIRVGENVHKGNLMPVNRTRVSKIDLAGAHAVARAMVKIYREAGCAKMKAFDAEIYLPHVETDRLPDFPSLVRKGDFRADGFPGLWQASVGG